MRGTSASVTGNSLSSDVMPRPGWRVCVDTAVGGACVRCGLQADKASTNIKILKRIDMILRMNYLKRLQLAIALDVFSNDRQAVIPKLTLGNIDAEALGKLGGCLFAGGGEQVLIVFYKFSAALFVDRI